MGLFFNEVKKAAPQRAASRRRDIPIQSLNRLGCSVCPRDKVDLTSPKMEPQGSPGAKLYILTSAPSKTDDEKGQWMTGRGGRAILHMLPRDFDSFTRIGGMVQCGRDDSRTVPQHETECCRGRVVRDIEETRPLIVMGVGDGPLAWATGLDAYAPRFRGRLIAAKFGEHVCWYYPINYPLWAFAENKYGPSEQETLLRLDIERLMDYLEGDLEPPHIYTSGYADGIETIHGTSAGDFQRLERALADIASEPRVGLDIETTGLRPYADDSLVLTAATGTFERVIAFPIDHPKGWGSEHTQKKVWSLFVEYLLFSGIKECHNLAFELEWFGKKIDPRITRLTEYDDTMTMSHVVDERVGTKSLDTQTLIHYGFNLKAQSRVDVSKPRWWELYTLQETLVYNGMDSKWTNRLSRTYREHVLTKQQRAQSARLVRLASTLVQTELPGLPCDIEYATDLQHKMEGRLDDITERLLNTPEVRDYRRRGMGVFAPSNTNHVLKLLELCKRDEIYTESGSVSTSEEVLSSIPNEEMPSAALIIEAREVEKLIGTYLKPVTTRKIVHDDGRIHAKYSSMIAETSRLAAQDPNSQNWPVRKNREVRGIVYAKEGYWIVAFDYGQIEFRVVGMASEDDNLVRYCWTGYDVHAFWAQRMIDLHPRIKDWIVHEFKVDWDEKGFKLLRQESKNKWVFPSLFGAMVKSRANNLFLPHDVAKELDGEFWDEFPSVKKWQKRILGFYEKHGYVETLDGVRRHGPLTPNQIINMPIQGTAARIVTEGMMAVSEDSLIQEDPNTNPILNVHDDLTFEMADDEHLETRIGTVARHMCLPRFNYINVPLVVEVKIGTRWDKLSELCVYRSDTLFNHQNPYK